MFNLFIVDLQKNKTSELPASRTIDPSMISAPIATTISTNAQVPVNMKSVEEPPSPTPIAAVAANILKKSQDDEENYPPVIKRKAKEPNQAECDVLKQLQDICFNMDPKEIYKDMVKIGQG